MKRLYNGRTCCREHSNTSSSVSAFTFPLPFLQSLKALGDPGQAAGDVGVDIVSRGVVANYCRTLVSAAEPTRQVDWCYRVFAHDLVLRVEVLTARTPGIERASCWLTANLLRFGMLASNKLIHSG